MTETAITEQGRPEAPLTGEEASTLLGFLDYQCATLAWKCHGLPDDQLRATVPPSVISLGGLLKHLARVEDYWFGELVADGPPLQPWASMPWVAEWSDAAHDTGGQLRRPWAAGSRCPRPSSWRLESGQQALATTHLAWDGQGRPSLSWVLTHLTEEYARHNGHADLVRETIDGQTGE